MMHTYTELDLIRFIYGETTPHEDREISYQLEDVAHLNYSFRRMLEAKRLLDELNVAPPDPRVLKNILKISRQTGNNLTV